MATGAGTAPDSNRPIGSVIFGYGRDCLVLNELEDREITKETCRLVDQRFDELAVKPAVMTRTKVLYKDLVTIKPKGLRALFYPCLNGRLLFTVDDHPGFIEEKVLNILEIHHGQRHNNETIRSFRDQFEKLDKIISFAEKERSTHDISVEAPTKPQRLSLWPGSGRGLRYHGQFSEALPRRWHLQSLDCFLSKLRGAPVLFSSLQRNLDESREAWIPTG